MTNVSVADQTGGQADIVWNRCSKGGGAEYFEENVVQVFSASFKHKEILSVIWIVLPG